MNILLKITRNFGASKHCAKGKQIKKLKSDENFDRREWEFYNHSSQKKTLMKIN